MSILKNLRIGTKLIVLILIFTLGLISVASYTFIVINTIDANSPAYQDIQRDNELIADILPPPLYIVESHLVSIQIFQEAEEGDVSQIDGLIKKAQQLQSDYQTRHEYWLQINASEDDLEIIQILVTDSYKPASEYFSIFNNEFIPAIQNNDFETAHHILHTELEPLYEHHRLLIDQIVSKQRAELAEDQTATQKLVNQQRVFLFGIAVMTVLLSLVSAITISRSISRPILQLTNSAEQIIGGNLQTQAVVESKDEIGKLASSFNDMTSRLRNLIADFESRVLDRTQSLDKRNAQLQAVADVGRSITSYRNLLDLLQQTTYLIHERFGYYHIGIFLLDDRKQYAILTAANSEGGRRMLERKHQLKVGETGIVGYVIEYAKARIALDVGKDAVYFDNPDLPETRSEMALPLVAGGQILGALDVQSTESQAFSDEDSAILQILAEQLAIAIQNANLFTEIEKTLEASRIGYGEVSREAWSKILRNQPRVGFIATPPATLQTYSQTLEPTLAKAFETGDLILASDNLTISLPIKVRGQAIGAIRLKKTEIAEAWTQEETNLAIALSDQLSGALESARLYQESQQRVARESLVSDISARITSISRVDNIVRETVQELGQALGNASVTFQLLDEFDGRRQADTGVLNPSKDKLASSETPTIPRKARE
ncbi:MAG: GAF domain-containing protein [Anaerolineales bacterium]|nr:GAF domain-containing protein [Anaerolineales bacterium]